MVAGRICIRLCAANLPKGDPQGKSGADPCPNHVRYEMMNQLGYFVTESSEHFAEYCPWFIKDGRDDLIEKYGIPLDEYPARCEIQIAEWEAQFADLQKGSAMTIEQSNEYAAVIMNAVVTNTPASIYGNVENNGVIAICRPTALSKCPAWLTPTASSQPILARCRRSWWQ